MSNMSEIFKDLSWFKISLNLECQTDRNIKYSTLQAILKGAYLATKSDYNWQKEGGANLIFQVKDKSYDSLKRKEDEIILEIFISQETNNFLKEFIISLKKQFALDESLEYYNLISIKAKKEKFLDLKEKYQKFINKEEIVLDFYTPFVLKEKKAGNNLHINKQDFINHFLKRFNRLFNINFIYEQKDDNFQLLSYWKYTRHFAHKSKSQPDELYLHGYVGKLYLKGKFGNFLPFLILGSIFNAGTKFGYGMGYYKLKESEIFFDALFPSLEHLNNTIEDLKVNYDNLLNFSENKDFENIIDTQSTLKYVFNSLKTVSYEFSPSKIFKIPKKNNSFRIVEEFKYMDMIVLKYINSILRDKLEKIFENESIGFRKGVSREKGVQLIKEGIKDGYEFIVESDISDFFPSINLKILENMIDFYIPDSDIRFRQVLLKAISIPYKENGEVKKREIGLPQGSPLSPLLANLYLHDFDQKIKKLNFRLIRYADDFIIMTKTIDSARKALGITKMLLAKRKLKIKEEKTYIRHIDEGFTFLGINFKGIESKKNDENLIKILKKPLYIIEPYIFLSLSGDSINIIKNKKVIQNIPIRRISEIIILDKAVFSTSFIKKMNYFKVAITITLESGYFVTTINEGNKNHYKVSMQHGKKYDEISNTEKLLIAKEIAKVKIFNYLKLIKIKDSEYNHILIKDIKKTLDLINTSINLNEVRGYEGSIARKTFANMNNLIINEKFHIKVRKRRDNDPINSLLNFGYYLLFTRINATIRAIGLNPYLGFLHSPMSRYESLVTDMQESFRARVDRLIIRILNLELITIKDFVFTDNGAFLNYEAKKKFILLYEDEFSRKEKITDISLKEEIYFQILSIKKWVLNDGNIKLYRWID